MADAAISHLLAERRVGSVLREKYRLTRVLGVGGMAAVYLGVHENNGNRVAVKVLHADASADPTLRARFLREGYVANALQQHGAVRVLDDDVADDGAAFLVMELLEGETLHARALRLGGKLAPREVLALGQKLCETLAAAHERGVIHRDIKPENLFLTTDRVLKVLDFGIARVRDAPGATLTWTGAALGTPAFMPPEQALGTIDEVGAAADVWGAGATLFTLLSGTYVHGDKAGTALLVQTATAPARSLAEAAPEIPAPVVAAIDRALRFKPADRWASAREMGAALAQAHVAAYGEPPDAAAIGPVDSEARAADPDAATVEVSGAASSLRPVRTTAPQVSSTLPNAAPPTLPSVPVPAPQPAPPRRRRAIAIAAGLIVAGLMASLGAASLARRAQRPPPAPPPPVACAEHRACSAKLGQPAICRRDDGACVALASEDCRVLASPGDVEDEATVWVGAMFPLTGVRAAAWGDDALQCVDLGRRDFAETTGGLPPARAGAPRRPLAVVFCDDGVAPARAAHHLVDELRLPAVIGFGDSREVAELADSHFLPRGVLALAANTASMLRTIPHAPGEPRLVYRVTVSGDQMLDPIALLVQDVLEPRVRREPGLLGRDEPVRVGHVRYDNVGGQEDGDRLTTTLRWNGRTLLENGAAYREIVVRARNDHEAEDAARAAEQLAAFRPHIVIVNIDFPVVEPTERAWPRAAPARPFYVGHLGLASGVDDAAQRSPELRGRVYPIDTSTSAPAVAKFVVRHNRIFERKVTAATGNSAPYDAFYTVAYAAAALGPEPITGRGLARAVARLIPPGAPIDVGPGGIYDALHTLAAGKNVDLQGTTTTLDFDLETGDSPADFSIFCVGPKGHTESGLVYRARTRKFEGAWRCAGAR